MLNELAYRIALQYLPNYGNILIKKLISLNGSAENIFLHPEKETLKLWRKNRALSKPCLTESIRVLVEAELEWMEKSKVGLCFYTDPEYPLRLKNCHDAPYMFYYKGSPDFNSSRAIAVVGTRKHTSYGKEAVKKIISEIAPYGASIVSGLAHGIDTIAHEQALSCHLNTIAVLGSGLDVIYPRSNTMLAREIVQGKGSVISEYPFKTAPDRQNFPRRNRVIAGMTDATIVIETGLKGGSMITAYIASSYNRDVFAIPGTIFNSSQQGCHHLIKTNIAGILTSGDDLAEMMGWKQIAPKAIQRELFVELTAEEQIIVELIKKNGDTPIDTINRHCHEYPVSKIAGILLNLELKGVLECKPGKIYGPC